ncbi:MAG: hypothetical protein ABL958_21910 [Bdellovibrionia bacterium]
MGRRRCDLGSELIHPMGDSTLVRDLGDAYMDHHNEKVRQEIKNRSGETQPPDEAAAMSRSGRSSRD